MERHISEAEFDRHFFDLGDTVRSWATVYRYLLFLSHESETQLMIGIGQKNVKAYWVNGMETQFSSNHPDYRVGISYWCYSGDMIHETRNEVLRTGKTDFASKTLSFGRAKKGYHLTLEDLDVELTLGKGDCDFVSYGFGMTPFSRYNTYLPFEGKIKGEMTKGIAFVQKVVLDMPFIPWVWGRTFFENGARFDFYEPRALTPIFKALNFKDAENAYRFNVGTKIEIEGRTDMPSWSLSGKTENGEELSARMEAHSRAQNVFATRHSTFVYNEYPARLTEFEIKKGSETLFSLDDLGKSATNCEDAYYAKLW